MLLLTLLVLHQLLVSAHQDYACSSPPRDISSPIHAESVYFLFVIDNSWPEYKVAMQKMLYQMIACEIPRSSKYRVGTIYAYAPKRAKDFVLDEKSLATADHFTTTLDDVVERSYQSRAHLPYDRSRCSRMHAVVEAIRLADFTYDNNVHSHYIFPTDDSEDDFVNDCDPAWTFKQSARNILNEATPNHLYLDVIRIGEAKRWTQYGERVQLADWSDRSINQKNVSHLMKNFLDGALRGDAVNDAIVFGTNGLKKSRRPKGVATFVTEPTPAPLPTTTSSSSSTSTTTLSTTSTSTTSTTTGTSTTVTTTTTAPVAETTTTTVANRQLKRGRSVSMKKAVSSERVQEDPAIQLLANNSLEGSKHRRSLNSTEGKRSSEDDEPSNDKHTVLGYQTPFTTLQFYLVVIGTTIGVMVVVWLICGLVFFCCYRDDDSIKKHDRKAAEEEDEMLTVSGLNEHDWDKPSSIMISDHLRKVKEDRYNEEQLRSSESRGTITVDV